MAWVALVVAGLLEVVGAIGLKYTEGFTRTRYTILVVVAFAVSFYLLSGVAEILPIGTAYAIWTGIGAAGTALFGMHWLGESRNAMRLASLALVVLGSMGMKAFG
jgi:quaternary ammonium compound-resistance protein SugE